MSPRTLMTQQIWFDTSPGGAGDVSHNSRCEKVRGWSFASPVSSHCLKRACLESDMGSRLEHGFISHEPVDLVAGKRVKIDLGCSSSHICNADRRDDGR